MDWPWSLIGSETKHGLIKAKPRSLTSVKKLQEFMFHNNACEILSGSSFTKRGRPKLGNKIPKMTLRAAWFICMLTKKATHKQTIKVIRFGDRERYCVDDDSCVVCECGKNLLDMSV